MGFFTKVYNWPAQDLQAVALPQSVKAGNNVILNGNLAKPTRAANAAPVGSIDFPDISRTVTIALSDSGNATFIVNGLRNGQVVSETVNISSASSGSTINFFDTIISIISPTGTNNLTCQIGTGLKGITRPFIPNSFITSSPVSTAVHTTVDSGTVQYLVIGSIEPWNNTGTYLPTPICLNQNLVNSVSGQYLTATPASASSFITASDLPLTMIAVNILGGTLANGSLTIRISTPRLST